MPEKSILIIGAGLAGLSAACYARMNGYRVRVFEQDTRPGGLCTSWERQGYTVHGNMAFVPGSGPGVAYHGIWQELGVLSKIRMIEYENLIIFKGTDGTTLPMPNDLDSLEKGWKAFAPEDAPRIENFVRGARIFARYGVPIEKAPELLGPGDKVKLLLTRFPLLRAVGKWKKVSIKDFASGFKNALMRDSLLVWGKIFSDDLPVALIMALLAWGHKKSCGFPEGGALNMARAIESRLLDLGGEVHYRSRVIKILVEDGKTVGIRLADGSEHRADYVISAADGRATIFDMLEGRYVGGKTQQYDGGLPLAAPIIIVGLGVARTFEDVPWSGAGTVYFLDKPVHIAGSPIHYLRPMIYNFDPTLAPPDKTFIRFYVPSDYDYWSSLARDPERYRAEKARIAETLVRFLDGIYPGFASQLEMWDVATPLTFERYTGNWRASPLGWDCTTKTFFMPMGKTLRGLGNFFMAGQWVEPGGGIPTVAVSGRNVIQLICRQDKKTFTVRVPNRPPFP
jgi:phytoene dehydrogenase-like protein